MIDTEPSRECHVFFSSTTSRDGQSLAELEPTTPLVGDRTPEHRTASTKEEGRPPAPTLREALKRELKIDAHTSKKQAA